MANLVDEIGTLVDGLGCVRKELSNGGRETVDILGMGWSQQVLAVKGKSKSPYLAQADSA